MLGTDLTELLTGLMVEVCSCDIHQLDICKQESIESSVRKFKPDIFINCAAYTAVDKSETDPLAMQVNGDAISNIVDVCYKEKIKLIHFSTDYIYSGKISSPIEETEATNPLNKYGESKLMGDNFILEKKGLDYILFRVQWLYGKNGKNFVDTMLRLSKDNPTVKVVNDQIGRPTSTKFLSRVVLESLQNNLHGIFNAGPANYCSWFDFASYILKDKNCKVIPIPSTEFPTPAKRPLFSVLSVEKIQKAIPDSKNLKSTWQNLVDEYLRDII